MDRVGVRAKVDKVDENFTGIFGVNDRAGLVIPTINHPDSRATKVCQNVPINAQQTT